MVSHLKTGVLSTPETPRVSHVPQRVNSVEYDVHVIKYLVKSLIFSRFSVV